MVQRISRGWLFSIAAIFLGTFFSASGVHAAGWRTLTSPTTNGLNGVDCGGASACVAVGDSGTIVSTADKLTWSTGTSGVTSTLYDVDMVSSTTGFAVGQSGVILKTTDNGATWTALTSGTTEILYDVSMASSTVGWAVGEDGTVLKTSNGSTWTDVSPGIADWHAVDATSTTNVWIAGSNGNIYRSSNGGTSWTSVSYSPFVRFTAIDVVSSTTAYVGGEGALIVKTTNSGTSWTAYAGTPDSFEASEPVVDLAFWTSTYGNAIGASGGLVNTADGGTTWTADDHDYPSTTVLNDATAYAAGMRILVGGSGFVALYDRYGPNAPGSLAMTDGDVTNDTTPTLTWTTPTDDEGSAIDTCEWSIDGGSTWDTTTSATSHTFIAPFSDGEVTALVRCNDEWENEGSYAEVAFTVDTTDPTVGSVSPTAATEDTATQFTVEASDGSDIASCTLYINSSSAGAMTEDSVSGDWTKSYTFSSSGSYSAYASCTDSAGNSDTGATTAVAVATAASSSTDTTAPSVGGITPTTAIKDQATTLSASYSDAVGVASCTLYVNSSSVGGMTLSGGTASKNYVFVSDGSYTVYTKCSDAAGNIGTGTAKTVTVSAGADAGDEDPVSEAAEGTLLKLSCDGGADVADPCHAVYYYGSDGKRHAFPNEKVYMTWYSDYDDLIVVTDAFMASLTLGRNVTYHPGTKMVKFVTVNTVYAVGEEGELRAIDSESTAASLYGSDWNQQIDDISDAFYGNYEFGDDIDSTSDYDPDEAEDSVDQIDDIL